MGCGCGGGNPGAKKTFAPTMIFGEKGVTAVEYIGIEPDKIVEGGFTGMAYPFYLRPKMFVDNRDLIFMLGKDFQEIEFY